MSSSIDLSDLEGSSSGGYTHSELGHSNYSAHSSPSLSGHGSFFKHLDWPKIIIGVLVAYVAIGVIGSLTGVSKSPWFKNVGSTLDNLTSAASWLSGNLWLLPLAYIAVQFLPGGLKYIAEKFGKAQRDKNSAKLSDEAKAAVGDAIASNGLAQRAEETQDAKYANDSKQLADSFDTWEQGASEDDKDNVDQVMKDNDIVKPNSEAMKAKRARFFASLQSQPRVATADMSMSW